jgi:serine/threonine-protein kinase HipA
VPESLTVYLRGAHVADALDAGTAQCALQYTDRGRSLGTAARLSCTLPVRKEPYPSAYGAMRWFRSLLPEGRALQGAVEEFGIPADDVFALLSVLGRDVAGAVMLLPPGQDPMSGEAHYEPLTDDEVANMVGSAHERPLGLDRERGVRLSLAGVQDKVLLHRPLRSRRWYLPVHGAASTVIIKPEPEQRGDLALDGLATNEALCLELANACRLPAASARVHRFGDRTCLLVDRYDRIYRDGQVERVHQEDLLTAMGKDPWLKYEHGNHHRTSPAGGFEAIAPVRNDPGPSLDDLAEFLTRHRGRVGLLELVEALTFNILIGNADAHARNLSLLLMEDGTVEFAPLYDLVCTRAYPSLDTTPAQRVNGKDDLDQIDLDDIVAHAVTWELPPDLVRRSTRQVSSRIEKRLETVVARTVDRGGDPVQAHRVAEVIAERVQRATQR